MPDLGPMGRGGARRRTRRRMTVMNEMQKSKDQDQNEPEEIIATDIYSEKLEKLAKLLKDKGVITETEYNLIFE
jgi:hypothetical protein